MEKLKNDPKFDCSFSDDNFFDDYDNNESISENQNSHYEVLTTHKMLKLLNNDVEEVSNVIQISKTTTRLLLNHLKWNKFELMERFFADENTLFRDTKLVKTLPQSVALQSEASNCEYCQICINVVRVSDLVGPECGHKFCVDCWNSYLTNKILVDGIAKALTCAAYNCSFLVEDEMCMKLLRNDRAIKIYRRIIIDGFVESSVTLRWCPNSNCHNVIKMDLEAIQCKPASCYCATNGLFCFLCGQNWHAPIKCTLLEKWNGIISQDNIESFKWLTKNTKKCPGCGVHIELSGGSTTVHCRNLECCVDFCWMCMNVVEENPNSNYLDYCTCSDTTYPQEIIENANSIQRDWYYNGPNYALLFYARFKKNKKLVETDKILRERLFVRTLELAKQGIPYKTRIILEEASDILVRCRQIAMYSSVFDFFFAENNQMSVFKRNQNSLLDAIDTLSNVLVKGMEGDFLDYKLLQRCAAQCGNDRRTLEDHIYIGYSKNWFQLKLKIIKYYGYLGIE